MRRGRRIAVAAGACGLALGLAGAASAGREAAASSFDAHWLRSGARADVFTIASARLAASHAVDPSVREAAQAMVAERLRVLARRQALARALRVPLPRRTDPVQTLQINELSAATADPAIFEPLFARTQAAAIQLAVLDTAEAARGAASPRVRTLARSLLPVLKRSLASLSPVGR